MASFTEEEGTLRIPDASPCRRDYQLRSFSPQHASDCDSSRPQSPWLPRSQLHNSEAMSPFRLYEFSSAAGPRDRPHSLSGPLPTGPARSYHYMSGPLPNPSPLPSYFSGATTRASRQLVPTSSFAGRLPEARSSGPESSFREGSGDDEVGDAPYTSYLRDADRHRFSPSPTNSGMQNGRTRNCMSGELGRSSEKAKVTRGYKSGEIVGLEIRADGIFPIPESLRKEDRAEPRNDGVVHKHRPSGSMLWEALNDADNESPRQRESSSAMVPVPFKWEEAAPGKDNISDSSGSKVSYSRTSSWQQARISSVQRTKPDSPSLGYYGGSEKTTGAEDSIPIAAKLAKSSSVSTAKVKAEDVGSSAVPFEWEVAPGKPKLQEKATEMTTPALQLPPRLVSASSMKRYSWSLSTAPPTRVRHTNRSLSASLATPSKHSHPPQEEPLSPSQEVTPRPRLSQCGTPQYQGAEYFCEDSVSAWNRIIRSPTSTLCGPGTPSSSSSDSRKPSVSFSHSQSGTSAESFDHWSYGDHVSPTSRHPPRYSYTESQSSNSTARGHDEGDQISNHDGAIIKLRRKLKLSSSKPPISPIRAPTRVVNDGYLFHGEEFFDCQAHASSPSPSPARIPKNRGLEEGVEPATRLPYKMPSPANDMELQAASAASSPTRAGPEFTNCLALPRFLSKGDTATLDQLGVENASDNARPISSLEDGYRSPAYKATLELLSPSPNLMSKSGVKLRSSSSRRRHPHLVEVLCNSLKQSLQRCTKRSVARTHSIVLYDDQVTKRHQSFMW